MSHQLESVDGWASHAFVQKQACTSSHICCHRRHESGKIVVASWSLPFKMNVSMDRIVWVNFSQVSLSLYKLLLTL